MLTHDKKLEISILKSNQSILAPEKLLKDVNVEKELINLPSDGAQLYKNPKEHLGVIHQVRIKKKI